MSTSQFASLIDPVHIARADTSARREAPRRDHRVAGSDLEHVATALRACPGVARAHVAVRRDRPSGRDLLAYLVLDGEAASTLAAIRARLANELAPGLMPATFIMLDAFPLDAHGRLDRAALPSPDDESLGLRHYEMPHGPVEKALSAIWQDVLEFGQVGRQAHFFELGGNSMLAVQLVHRLRQTMGVDVAMRDLFDAPLLHRFAQRIAARIGTAGRLRGESTDTHCGTGVLLSHSGLGDRPARLATLA